MKKDKLEEVRRFGVIFELDGEIEELGHKVTRLGYVIESIQDESLRDWMRGRGARLVYQDDWSGEYRLGLISIPPYDSDTRDLMRKQSLNNFQRVYNSFYVFIIGAHGFDPAIAVWYSDLT